MAHENKVIQSLEDPNGVLCVDVFRRPDGSFGFQICRRDPEDGRGWAVIGDDNSAEFADSDAALAVARKRAPWI